MPRRRRGRGPGWSKNIVVTLRTQIPKLTKMDAEALWALYASFVDWFAVTVVGQVEARFEQASAAVDAVSWSTAAWGAGMHRGPAPADVARRPGWRPLGSPARGCSCRILARSPPFDSFEGKSFVPYYCGLDLIFYQKFARKNAPKEKIRRPKNSTVIDRD